MAALATRRGMGRRRVGVRSSRPTLTRQLAWSAATDAGNKAMRKAGRSKWSEDDYNTAAREFERLWPVERDNPSITAERGIHFTLGILGSGASRKSEVQSVVFDREKWTVAQAKDWLKSHGFKSGSVDEKANTLRFRQEDPGKYKGFSTISPGDERRMNPEAASESMYESFHGAPSTETLEYEQDLHYHGNLAALGELVELKVNLLDGNKAKLTFDGESSRESNPSREQASLRYLVKLHGQIKRHPARSALPHTQAHERNLRAQLEKLYDSVSIHIKRFGGSADARDSLEKASESLRVADVVRDDSSLAHLHDAISILQHSGKKNPFWPFSSFHKTTIYHVPTNEKYSRATSHGGYNIYKSVKAGDTYFLVPELDRGSKFDSLRDAKKFIDHWNKGRRNPKRKRVTGPFTESGKLLGKATRAASRPLEEFTGTVGKIGGYLDRKIGKVLNPWHVSMEGKDHKAASVKEAVKLGKRLVRAKSLGSGFAAEVRNDYGGYEGQIYYEKGKLYLTENLRKLLRERQHNPEIPSDSAVLLTTNEKGTQLYLVGGDQSLSLSDLGITGPEADKEHIVIGDVTHIVYRTHKDFDGHKDLEYQHTFSEDSKGPLPELVYDRINQRLSLVGGVYFIKQPMLRTSPGLEN